MKTRRTLAAAAAAAALAGGLAASPAQAAVDDSFSVDTQDYCGTANFVDYGPGAPGGGDNDDYVEIWDLCADGDGVRAWARIDGNFKGTQYNGNGSGSETVWDPFGNIPAGHTVELEVCLVDGPDDYIGYSCDSGSRYIDG